MTPRIATGASYRDGSPRIAIGTRYCDGSPPSFTHVALGDPRYEEGAMPSPDGDPCWYWGPSYRDRDSLSRQGRPCPSSSQSPTLGNPQYLDGGGPPYRDRGRLSWRGPCSAMAPYHDRTLDRCGDEYRDRTPLSRRSPWV